MLQSSEAMGMDKGLEGPSLCSSSAPEQLCFYLLGIEVPWKISIAEKSFAALQKTENYWCRGSDVESCIIW